MLLLYHIMITLYHVINEKRRKIMLKQVPVRLEEDFVKRVKILCIQKGISFQEIVKVLLEKWLEENEGKS